MPARVLILHRVADANRVDYIDRFVTLFEQAGASVETLHLDRLAPVVTPDGPRLQTNQGLPVVADVVFLQTTLRSALDRNKLAAVKAAGLPVVNDPDAAAVSADKHLTALALATAGLPVVEHVLLGGPAPVKEMVAQRFSVPVHHQAGQLEPGQRGDAGHRRVPVAPHAGDRRAARAAVRGQKRPKGTCGCSWWPGGRWRRCGGFRPRASTGPTCTRAATACRTG
jgi:hypothetical protein